MAWTVHEIEKEWLAGSIMALALPSDAGVAAFSRVENLLGRTWMDTVRASGGSEVRGTVPTLSIVGMGQRLAALDGVSSSNKLIDRIKRGDKAANAELTAIFLVRHCPEVQIELEPPVGAGRLADFRTRERDRPWTYLEVTLPDWSKAHEHAIAVLERVASLVQEIKRSFSLEVFLRREPSEEEIGGILAEIPTLCHQQGQRRHELHDGLGLLLLNMTAAGQVILDDHGEEPRPRIGVSRAIGGGDEEHRYIAVRMGFSDQRAEAFLDSEAGQLSKDAPGLVMIGTGRAPGAMRVWEPLFKNQFELALHTQVSGICLFSGGMLPTAKGEAWMPQTKLILNQHAKFDLPNWLKKSLIDAGAEFERVNSTNQACQLPDPPNGPRS